MTYVVEKREKMGVSPESPVRRFVSGKTERLKARQRSYEKSAWEGAGQFRDGKTTFSGKP